MFKEKVAQIFLNLTQFSNSSRFCFNVMFFKIGQKLTKYLGYFCKKICHQEFSIITQSGHTGPLPLDGKPHHCPTATTHHDQVEELEEVVDFVNLFS